MLRLEWFPCLEASLWNVNCLRTLFTINATVDVGKRLHHVEVCQTKSKHYSRSKKPRIASYTAKLQQTNKIPKPDLNVSLCICCVHNASTVPWTSAGQFGRPRGVRGRPWYDLWRPRCVISHPMDVRGLPPGRPPSGRPRDTQFGIDWSLLPSRCPQGVRTAEVQPITARTHYGQEVGLPTVRPKPEVDVP